MNIYVPGKGIVNPRIAFVGEAPSFEEEKALEPFVGTAGRFFRGMLNDAGININDCWVTNACKFMVPANAKKGRKIPFHVRASNVGIDMTKQIEELRKELYQVNPTVVCALGNTALWALTGKDGIEKQRGSIMLGMGFKTIPTYHPMHILYQEGEVGGYWTKQLLAFDLQRVKEESEFKDVRLPYRNLQICQSPQQFADFRQRYRNHTRPAIDIEAHKCVPICIGISFTPDEGITIPLWNLFGVSDLPDEVLVVLWEMVSDFLAQHDVVGQNFNGYDRDKIKRLGLIIRSLGSDTMLKAFCINPELPKNLAFNTSIYTKEPYYKDEGMYEGSMRDLLIGCARDACVTKEIDLKQDKDLDELGCRDYYEKFLLPLSDLYGKIECNGFRVDMKKRKELINKYIEMREKLDYELYRIAGAPVNVSSWQQVAALLYTNWRLPERSGTDEETLTSILNGNTCRDPIKRRGIEIILELRRVKKTINTYLYSLADFDGRMRTAYFLCLETGRSSTNQQDAPIRPTHEYRDEEKKKKKQSMGMAFQTITKHGDIGADIRAFLIPDEGCCFLQADSSQAEARVIFLLAEDYQALKDIDEHDYHALTASWFFGGTESDYSKKVLGYESPKRFVGKTLRHAGHLGAKARRASIEVNTSARKFKIEYKISEREAQEALDIFHAKQPRIRRVYHDTIISLLEKDRRLIAPVPVGIAAGVGGTRIFFERWGDELFRQAFSYLPQRTVSENTKSAALYIDKECGDEVKIIVESHDALAIQVKEKYRLEAAKIMKYAFERPIDFSTCSIKRGELVIPCEVEIGYNYKDLNKFTWVEAA